MAGKEDEFREWLKKNIFYNCHFQRIENNTSVPDINVCTLGGVEFWLELKINNEGQGILLRPNQYAWCMKRGYVYNGAVFVLALRYNYHNVQEIIGKETPRIELYTFPLKVELTKAYGKNYVRIISQPVWVAKKDKNCRDSLLEQLTKGK